MLAGPPTLVINSESQPRFVPSNYQCVHIKKGGVISTRPLANMDKSAAVSAHFNNDKHKYRQNLRGIIN